MKSVVIMDQAAYHRGDEELKMMLNRGISVMFLPASSSNLNPIERLWAVLKYRLTKKLAGYNHIRLASLSTEVEVNAVVEDMKENLDG